jgi:arylformamidase
MAMSERFLGYERDALDRQYDLIGQQGERFDVYCRLYESLSDHARTAFPHADLDVDCGEGLVMDLFPAEQPDAPILLFLPGGLTANRNRRDVAFLASGLVPHGCALALADGCQPQNGNVIHAIDNARRAVLWLRAHADRLNGDAGRIVVMGQGLGVVPAALTLTADWSYYDEDAAPEAPVAGLAGISGIFDLEPVHRCFLNGMVQLDATMTKTYAPLVLASSIPKPRPSVWLAVGAQETDEYHRQMLAYGMAAEASECTVTASTEPDHNHFSLLAELGDPSSVFTKRLIDWVLHPAVGESIPI